MRASTRRGAMGAFLGLGICASVGLFPAVARANGSVAIPTSPMLLSRRIERSLKDGASLSVDRSWRVNFASRPQGISISGEQIEASVSAPETLAPLAAIEEGRSTDEMWPIMLSADGRIVRSGMSTREDDLAAAIEQAQQMISSRAIPASEQEAQMQYIAELAKAGSSLLARLPDDLFFPRLGPVRSVREVELPGGLTGEFEVSYSAVAASSGNWLARAEREVITRLGGSEQRAHEVWNMRDI